MEDVNISKYRASVVRDGSKPASPGFVVSEGQDPVNPPGTNNYVPYSGATANVELGEFGVEAGFVTLDTTPTNIPTDQGAIYWDDTRSTAALIMNGTLQHIGQDSFFYVKNSSGSTIPKGTCVGFAGTDGASGHLLVTPFLANGSVPSTYFMGVTAEAITNGSFGQVMHFGELTGINTSGFTAGALLYASSTVAGAFQTTAPVAPNNIILVAAAVNSKNNGAIVVRPTLGSNINSDEGVKITSPTTGDLLQLQAGGLWENKTLAQVIGSAYVPSTRTITINGTTQDLSADRTFNVGTVTSVGLSSATSGVTIGSTPVTSSGTITLAIATASGSQNGLLSSTDWTTFNNKIGGTLATGQVAFGTAANTIGGDNGLFWDNTNKRLGVGSIIPISRIHISGNSAENTQYSAERVASAIGSSTQLLSLTAIGQIPTLTSSSANIRIIGDATWSSTSSPSRVQFETTSVGSTTVTERWRITSAGILQSNGAQTIQTSTGNLTLATAAGNGNINLVPNGSGIVDIRGFNDATNLTSPTLRFTDTDLSSANNQITGKIEFFTSDTVPGPAGVHSFIQAETENTSGIGRIVFGTGQSGSALERWRITSTGILQSNGAQTIQTSSGALTLQPTGGASTGINLTNNVNIYSALNTGVIRNTITNGSIVISGGNGTGDGANLILGGSTGTNQVQVRIGTTNHSIFATTGNLLIGTTTDSGFRLDVNGTARVTSTMRIGTINNGVGDFITTDANGVLTRRTAAQTLTDIGGQAALTNPVTGTGTTNCLPKFTGASTIGNSNVIDNGTTVSVLNSAYTDVFRVGSSLNSLYFYPDGGSVNIMTGAGFTGSGITFAGGSNYLDFNTNSLTRMRLSTSGNLLVGTTTDNGARLQVSGFSRFDRGTLQFTLNPSYAVGNVYSQLQSTGALALATGGDNNRLYIDTSGNVGIGTTTFAYSPRLAVASVGQNSIAIQTTDTVEGSAGTILYLGTGASTGNSTFGIIRALGNGGTDATNLVLQESGNVLIGTTTDAGYKLDVNGTSRSSVAYKFGTYTAGSTTPNVSNVSIMIIANSSPTTITNFTNAVAGQVLTLGFSDSNTTINRANAYLLNGNNYTSGPNDFLQLVFDGTYWFEISRSSNA